MKKNIYDIIVKDTEGNDVSLKKYKGKVLLIVNTASQCGFTPQLTKMTELYEQLEGEDFEILAFPSNDFNGQEPLDGEAAKQFCMLEYKAAYPIFEKVSVKGKDTSDLYKFLSFSQENGKIDSIPKWNFHKYLINKEGEVVDYFYSFTSPNSKKVVKKIKSLL